MTAYAESHALPVEHGSVTTRASRWPNVPALARWRSAGSTMATAAIVLATMLSAWAMINIVPTSPSANPPHLAVAPPPATPTGTDQAVELCGSTDIYFGCPSLIDLVGGNVIQRSMLDSLPDDVQDVQLAGWALAPGASIAGGDDFPAGVAVDVVVSGAYVAIFDVPVVVARGGVINRAYQYLDPGTQVELVRGDAVAYLLGGLLELHSALSVERLEFKRATLSAGPIMPAALPDGVTTREEATGTLPRPITDYEPDVSIGFWYLQVREGAFPPPAWQDATTFVLGPVDPQRGPAGTEGFVLVVRETIG